MLQDPRQRRLFSQRDLRDLFALKADTGSLRGGGDGATDTAQFTRGIGVVDPTTDVGNNEDGIGDDDVKDDNEDTLKTVMKSKGLAGVFDVRRVALVGCAMALLTVSHLTIPFFHILSITL